MRNPLSNLLPRPAATGWLRAGILVLVLAAYGVLAVPTTGAEPVRTASTPAAISAVDVAEGGGLEAVATVRGGIIGWPDTFGDPPAYELNGAHAWAG